MKTIDDIIDNLCVMTIDELLLLGVNVIEELKNRHKKKKM